MKDEIDIGMIESRIDTLFEKAKNLDEKESTKLFEEEIIPLMQIQRSFLRAHEGIPQAVFD